MAWQAQRSSSDADTGDVDPMTWATTLATTALFAGALLLCIALLKVAIIAGRRYGLVDKPDRRKLHSGEVPLVGGACIFITLLALQLMASFSAQVILAGGVLLLVGVADDFLDLSATIRLFFQALAASILVIGGGLQINSLGGLVPDSALLLNGSAAIAFSIVCVIGVINAVNMIDGADGLAGGITAISVLALLCAALMKGGDVDLTRSLVVLLGAIVAFLLFNSGAFGQYNRVFLGDSGSMLLGLLLVSYYIGMSQGQAPYLSPVVAGWVFGLPLMDSISVIVRRVIRGKSPVNAGRDHLHHRLMRAGLSSGASVACMLVLHALLVTAGIVGDYRQASPTFMFWAFVLLLVVYHLLVQQFLSRNHRGQY